MAWGCDGIIAAPQDNPDAIRRAADAEGLLVVTPGVRPAGSARDDHKRSGTPAEAIALGADYLVVGRPIVKSPDPAAAAAQIIADMRNIVTQGSCRRVAERGAVVLDAACTSRGDDGEGA